MNLILSLILVLMFAASQGQTRKDSSVPIKELRNAPTEVVLDNRTLQLSISAWRNFMPGPVGRKRPLMIAFKLSSFDEQPLPNGV